MKLIETDFFQQYTAVVAGTVLAMMIFAFISIPLTLNAALESATRIGAMSALA